MRFVRAMALTLCLLTGAFGEVRSAGSSTRSARATFQYALGGLDRVARLSVTEEIRYEHLKKPRSSILNYATPRRLYATSLQASSGQWTDIQVGDTRCRWYGSQRVARCSHSPWASIRVSSWVQGMLLSPALRDLRFSLTTRRPRHGSRMLIVTIRALSDPYFCPTDAGCLHEARGLRRKYAGALTIDPRTGMPRSYTSFVVEKKKHLARQAVHFSYGKHLTIHLPSGKRVFCAGGSADDWCIRRTSGAF